MRQIQVKSDCKHYFADYLVILLSLEMLTQLNSKRANPAILTDNIIAPLKSSKYLAMAVVEWQDTDENQVRQPVQHKI